MRYVTRDPAIQEARNGLPILAMEQETMQAVDEHDVILLCGETGCGKTTQVPQFLFEAGYGCRDFPERSGMIGVTQPRRVAAVSTAKRVATELATEIGDLVGYHVRYDAAAGTDTSVKFMTDGILMRELQSDFLLLKYVSATRSCIPHLFTYIDKPTNHFTMPYFPAQTLEDEAHIERILCPVYFPACEGFGDSHFKMSDSFNRI